MFQRVDADRREFEVWWRTPRELDAGDHGLERPLAERPLVVGVEVEHEIPEAVEHERVVNAFNGLEDVRVRALRSVERMLAVGPKID